MQLGTIARGQLISGLIAGTGFFASLLSNNGFDAPVFLSTLNYVLLIPYFFFRGRPNAQQLPSSAPSSAPVASESGVSNPLVAEVNREQSFGDRNISGKDYNHRLLLSSGREPRSFSEAVSDAFTKDLSCPLWLYLCIALIDLEANVLIISAYQYTTVTSIMLLDCFSIPCVMLLSRLFLGARYLRAHLVGTAFCLLGMACIVLSDNLSADSESAGSNPLYGDMLCLIGTSMYGASNVIQEKLVKHRDREEYLGLLGAFGAVIGSIQIGVTEAGTLASAEWDAKNVAFVAGFLACINLMYTRASEYLKSNDAAYLNLSLLTSDVYAVIFSFLVYGYIVHWLYFIAFGLTCVGLFIYSRAPSPTTSLSATDAKAAAGEATAAGARAGPAAGAEGIDDARADDGCAPPASAFFYHSLPVHAEAPAPSGTAATSSGTYQAGV